MLWFASAAVPVPSKALWCVERHDSGRPHLCSSRRPVPPLGLPLPNIRSPLSALNACSSPHSNAKCVCALPDAGWNPLGPNDLKMHPLMMHWSDSVFCGSLAQEALFLQYSFIFNKFLQANGFSSAPSSSSFTINGCSCKFCDKRATVSRCCCSISICNSCSSFKNVDTGCFFVASQTLWPLRRGIDEAAEICCWIGGGVNGVTVWAWWESMDCWRRPEDHRREFFGGEAQTNWEF